MKLWIGTSGFQYTEWRGTFYPEKLSTAKMLPFYADRFNTTEVNYTFHRIPSAKTIDGWCNATPAEFQFSLKAPQRVTHFQKLRNCADTMRYFCEVVQSLERKLGPVLFQLPPGLKKDVELLGAFLQELPPRLRCAFEFRHESWFDDAVFDLLRQHNTALCIADSEKLSTPLVATADFGCLRLRREDYTSDDVKQWGKKVQAHSSTWSDALVYFKHEESGTGPKLALQLMELLGVTPATPSAPG
jgi:uncharacterized protein YecE (DUF72 family)